MQVIRLKLKKRSYNIIVGNNIIGILGRYLKELNIGSDAYVITNPLIKKKYAQPLQNSLRKTGFSVRFKLIPDTEKSKSIESSASVIKDLAGYDKKRRIFIIAFGGGVIGDLAGFVASIYKRGVPFVQVPTTLLAQVDSAIGGKTALDLAAGKNLVGAFYQPRLVFSDVKYLNTLSQRELRCGLAEVIKYAVIKDRQLFVYLEKRFKNILNLDKATLEYIVERCSRIKADIVSRDEKEEKGLRTILNFGHTVGHAIEAAAGYAKYNHGEAIALGMIVAADISSHLDLIDNCIYERIGELIIKVGLPAKIEGISTQAIINAHYHDKKFLGSKNRFVLLKDIGRTKIVENVALKIIKHAIAKLQK